VGRDRLGIAVDHDGLEAVLAQLQRGVHAAVVELDPLPDAVGPAAEDHDLAGAARARLALLLVSRVEIRGRGRELGRAGVDALVHRPDLQLVTLVADRLLRHVEAARPARAARGRAGPRSRR